MAPVPRVGCIVVRPQSHDIVAMLAYIADRLDAIEGAKGSEMLSASAAAREFGLSLQTLLKPWNVPGFKRHGTRFDRRTWTDWLATPEKQRRSDWDMMDWRERSA